MDGYNGYKNYETWAVNLWLMNDQGSYEYLQELKKEHTDKYDFADCIEDLVKDIMPDLPASMFSDLLGHAVQNVDFVEIAENFMED